MSPRPGSPASPADDFRRWGWLQADLDPLGRLRPRAHPDLDRHAEPAAAPWRRIYSGAIGAEFAHIPIPERVAWMVRAMEDPVPAGDADRILRRLMAAELFERYLHRRYVGTKRYSLEGAAALIPCLDAILEEAAADGVEVALIGMAHRGRLNVLAHIVGTPAAHLFAQYEDVDPRSVLGSGDVRYHLGATGAWRAPDGRQVQIHLVSNPSHLEAVDAVMLGRARARQERRGVDGARRVLPILLHGDAAIAGQGIAAEALNLADLPGFRVGGTVHVVVNNLIGFTTEPAALHSSRFAADIAHRLPIPILHVNGEDPEAADRAGRIAHGWRRAFRTDVVVDLVGYRRYGHSEVDDPTTTQPLLYRSIEARPMLWELYAERRGVPAADREREQREIHERLDRARDEGRAMRVAPQLRTLPPWWDRYTGGPWRPADEPDTGVDAARLREVAAALTGVPAGFHLHPKIRRGLDDRAAMAAGARAVDWGMAEALAFGSLLRDGLPVRLAGEDSRRGTFNHRHAAWIDTVSEGAHVPLAHLHPEQARFTVLDTSLSEYAALGFEYGYSRDTPEGLVLWEAQFGDFANGAQVIIDQFLCAGEAKWGLLSGLVLLLPHGHEGQGPEHSSARLERFLQLAAADNIQICQPSTAAQYFHLLRRQALRAWRKPLVVLTPKSLLRAAPAASAFEELTLGRFRTVLGDPDCSGARRILVCSGKIAHELAAERRARGDDTTAIVRVEQFSPVPEAELRQALEAHAAARDIVWVQEEPANMGALFFMRPLLQRLLGGLPVRTVKRRESASPATGSARAHALEQEALLRLAFGAVGGAA